MHTTKSYRFLWLHEEKQGQGSTFTGGTLAMQHHPAALSTLFINCNVPPPPFASKPLHLDSVQRSLHGGKLIAFTRCQHLKPNNILK